jgi:hypothetical protein
MQFALGAATLLGVVVLPPRVSVEKPADAVDAFHPFELPFTISNDGYFPIYRVKINCIPHELVFQKTPQLQTENGESKLSLKNQAFAQIPELTSGEKMSFVCDVFHFADEGKVPNSWPVVGSDVGVGITFRPVKFLHWRVFRQFTFAATISSSHLLRWHYPMLEQKQATYPPSY